MRLSIVPCTLAQANKYVALYHRHNGEVLLARFSLAIADDLGVVRGVAIVGRPNARNLDDHFTVEVKRVCTDGTPNTCSMLYGASWKTAKAMGYRRCITYTLPIESQSSLKAVGWICTPDCGGSPWNNRQGRADTAISLVKKNRWQVSVETELPFTVITFPKEDASSQLPMFESEITA